MEFYMNYYDNYNKIIVFDFRMFEGGVGDYIKYFIQMLKRQMRNGVNIDWNKKKHQFGGSECGVYSMNFIIESIKGNKLPDIENKKISDYSVNVLRNYFYRPPKKSKDISIIKIGGKDKK